MNEHAHRLITVAHVVPNLEVGGLERVVVNLMTKADESRYRRVLVCLGHGGELADELADNGYAVHRMHRRPGLDYFLLLRLAGALRRERADVVHCHNFSPLVYGSLAGLLAGRRPVVYTAHGAKTSGRRKQRWFQRLRLASEMVYVSRDARQVALSTGSVRAEGSRTIVNGIDIGRYAGAGAREKRRSEFAIAPDAPVFGIVGRLTPAKDHRNLFRAFRRLRDAHPSAKLLVVGDGELKQELDDEVRNLSIESGVISTGNRSDIPELLSAMDVFVLSSCTEGLAMTLLEAMAARLPIVATSVGGNTEAVVDGETGLIVPPGDDAALARAMAAMLEDRARAREMGAAGRERVHAHFSTEAMVDAYQELYERQLNPVPIRRTQ